jgi:hypothetical protein
VSLVAYFCEIGTCILEPEIIPHMIFLFSEKEKYAVLRISRFSSRINKGKKIMKTYIRNPRWHPQILFSSDSGIFSADIVLA